MKKNSYVNYLYFLGLVVLDQAIKFYIQKYYPQIISLNTGVIFGYITNIYIVATLLILASIILGYLIFRSKNIDISLILILAGAISNIIDRFVYKAVVDYIHLGSLSIFNIADIYIVIGVAIYIYKLIFITRYKN